MRLLVNSFETDVLYSFITDQDPIELRAQSSDIETYDQQEWDLNIVAVSQLSTHENRESSIDFKLTLRDVCWDLPLTAADLTENEFTFKV